MTSPGLTPHERQILTQIEHDLRLPAGTIIAVDAVNRTVQVGRSKDEIKDSPEYNRDKHTGDSDYRNEVGTYYGGML